MVYKSTINTLQLSLYFGLIKYAHNNKIDMASYVSNKDNYNLLSIKREVKSLENKKSDISQLAALYNAYNKLNFQVHTLNLDLAKRGKTDKFINFTDPSNGEYQIDITKEDPIKVTGDITDIEPVIYAVSRYKDEPGKTSLSYSGGFEYNIYITGINIIQMGGVGNSLMGNEKMNDFFYLYPNGQYEYKQFPHITKNYIDTIVMDVIGYMHRDFENTKEVTLSNLQKQLLEMNNLQMGNDPDQMRKVLVSSLFNKL